MCNPCWFCSALTERCHCAALSFPKYPSLRRRVMHPHRQLIVMPVAVLFVLENAFVASCDRFGKESRENRDLIAVVREPCYLKLGKEADVVHRRFLSSGEQLSACSTHTHFPSLESACRLNANVHVCPFGTSTLSA